jgi:hypothetical protein
MLRALLFSILAFAQFHVFAQVDEFFKGIDFDSSYTIVGLSQSHGMPVDTFSRFCFVIDDPAVMDSLKKKWVFTEPVYSVDFADANFNIYVVRFGRIAVPTGVIYPTQGAVVSSNRHWHKFDTAELVRLHIAHPLHFREEIKRFDTWNEYVTYGNNLSRDSNLLLFFEPSMLFEGKFDIITNRTPDASSPVFVMADINKELAKLTAKSKFQADVILNDTFNMAHLDKVKIRVRCSKDLYERYDVNGRDKGPWQPIPIEITIFWRDYMHQ